ncbi:MAG: MoxR family ATPase [Candidatus Heimdallarchaeota archaeon]|nr:MAG: MoxR family ATPase [Candidatus Heimdallarchaeota archaeon]
MFDSIIPKISPFIIGRTKELELIIAALEAQKHILLEGAPGTSKSTILRLISEHSALPIYIMEGNADLTPSKLTGQFDPSLVIESGYKPEFFVKGPLFLAMEQGGLLYVDEFNRMASDASNVLIRAIEENELVIPRYGLLKANKNFRVVLAQNPYDEVGVGKISRALFDRLIRISMGYQSELEEQEIVRNEVGDDESSELTKIAVRLVRATREHLEIKQGASVRGAIDTVAMVSILMKLSQYRSAYEILRDSAIAALSGKIWLDPASERSAEEIIEELLLQILRSSNLTLEVEWEKLEQRKKK